MLSPRLILAGTSPHRRLLLRRAGFAVEAVIDPAADETPRRGETPSASALRLARCKASLVAERLEADPAYRRSDRDWVVLGADTIVHCGGRTIEKPRDAQEAEAALRRLSGRSHRTVTAVATRRRGDRRLSSRCVVTRIAFKRLSAEDIADYLSCGEWRGVAGGYAIQGRAGAFVIRLSGSPDAATGLPLYHAAALLQGAGVRRSVAGDGDATAMP